MGRKFWVVMLGVSLGGCANIPHVTCAPQSVVEGCLLESYPASGAGWGPECNALNEFAKLHGWLYGGEAGVHPPHPVPPTPEQPAPGLPPVPQPAETPK